MIADIHISLTSSFLGDDGQRAGFFALGGFLAAFLFIRTSARMIRMQVSWWPGNVETSSGLHIHHLVWGIVTIMFTGFVNFAVDPASPWRDVLATLFGIGCGLTLDEFALWLRLDDVYWEQEGRESVDAVIIATIIGGMIVVGVAPFDTGDGGGITGVGLLIASNLLLAFVAVTKGKVFSAVTGAFIPFVALIAAVRLAKPGSRWAKRRYPDGSKKLARAQARDERVQVVQNRFTDLVGGTPSK